MKKENLVGLIGLLVLVAFLWAYTSIKRSGVLKRSLTLYSEYDSIFHLKPNNWVLYNGMYVGYISGQEKHPQTGKIKITMTIVEKVSLHPETEAVITYTSVIGGRQINLIAPAPCYSGCLQGEETLKGRVLSIPQSIKDGTATIRAKADSVLDKYSIRGNVDSLLYSTMASIEKLRKNTDLFASRMPQLSKTVKNSVNSYQELSEQLKKDAPSYAKKLDSLNQTMAGLQKQRLDLQLQSASSQIDSVGLQIGNGSAYIQTANQALQAADKQIKNIKTNPSVQSLLLSDSSANQAHDKVKATDAQIKDIYEHPEKYRRVLSKGK